MFNKYQNYLILSKEIFNQEHPNYYLIKDIYYPLTKEEKEHVDIKIIANNSNLEKIVLTLNGKNLFEEKIYQKEEKKMIKSSKNIWERITNYFHKIF